MMTYAADFWPLFWTILGAGALLTALVSLLIGTFSPAWIGSHHGHQPKILRPDWPAGQYHSAEEPPKAA
jgi:hypothetical protein